MKKLSKSKRTYHRRRGKLDERQMFNKQARRTAKKEIKTQLGISCFVYN